MGRMFVASILMSITSKPQPTTTTDVEIAPMVPGAWAAWSRTWDGQASHTIADPKAAQSITTLRPVGSEA